MLSDHEQRAIEDLERSYASETPEPVRAGRARQRSPRRSNRPPGFRVVVVLACASAGLVFASVPEAAFALALATAIGWWFWRLWSHRAGDGSLPAPPDSDQGPDRPARRPAAVAGRHLRWLAEEER